MAGAGHGGLCVCCSGHVLVWAWYGLRMCCASARLHMGMDSTCDAARCSWAGLGIGWARRGLGQA
jgi:hypothetical protein